VNIQVTRKARHALVVRFPGKVHSRWEQWCLLRSDAHHDNKLTDHDLERKHLDQALERGAIILDCGDLHCAMGGKWDRRANPETTARPEYCEGRYLDKLVEHAADFYGPYAKNWVLMGHGNHETAILRAHETDLTERTVERIKAHHDAPHLYPAGYSGWVVFQTDRGISCKLYWHHGASAGGIMSHGTLDARRIASYTPDADVIWSGHSHDQWFLNLARNRITDQNTTYHDTLSVVRTPGYKQEAIYEHWAVERGHPPKPNGGMWMRMFVAPRTKENKSWVIRAEFIPAT
jgi:hypothetical protein